MNKSNTLLMLSLIESTLFEDDQKSKLRKIFDTIKQWLKDAKDKVVEMFRTLRGRIYIMWNRVKMVVGITRESRAWARTIVQFDKEMRNFAKSYEDYSKQYDEVESEFEDVFSNVEKVYGGSRSTDIDVEAVLKDDRYEEAANGILINKKMEDIVKDASKGDSVSEADEDKNKYTAEFKMAIKARERIFATYRKLCKRVMSDIKKNLTSIGSRIKKCEDAVKKEESEASQDSGNKKGKVPFGKRVKIYFKVIGSSIKFTGRQIATIIKLTGLLVKGKICSIGKGKSDKKDK